MLLLSLSAATSGDPLLLRCARGEPVERPPVWMMRQAGRHMAVYRELCKEHPTFRDRSENADVATEITLQPWRRYGVDGVILFSDILTPLPAMGVEFQISELKLAAGAADPGAGDPITIEPLRTEDDVRRFEEATFDPAAALPFVGETLQNCRRAVEGSGATVLGFVGAPFTLASYLVEGGTGVRSGFAQTRTMREESPELLHRILDVLATRIGEYLCYQIDSGAQVVQCFDSWAGHLDTEAFDEFAAPYLRRVVEVVKRERPGTPTIVYIAPAEHSRNGALLDRLAATGADIVGIDHTTDLVEARAALGACGVGTQGNLDPDLLRNGPIDAIERAAAEVLTAAKAPGGAHIVNLGHGIMADTPEEHAEAFIRAVQAAGGS